MGILSDFFAASRDELDAKRLRHGPVESYDAVESGGVSALEMATLLQIATGGDLGAAVDKIDEFEDVLALGAGGPWVVRLTVELQQVLATATESELAAWSEQWAATDELEAGGFEPDVCKDLLVELSALARRESTDGRNLYLWNSL